MAEDGSMKLEAPPPPVGAGGGIKRVSFATYQVLAVGLIALSWSSGCTRSHIDSLSQRDAEQVGSKVTLGLEAYYWHYGRLPATMRELESGVNTSCCSVPRDILTTWEIPVLRPSDKTVFLNLEIAKGTTKWEQTETIELVNGAANWQDILECEGSTGKLRYIDHPIHDLHRIAEEAYGSWLEHRSLPPDGTSLSFPAGDAPKLFLHPQKVLIRELNREDGGLAFQVTIGDLRGVYRFSRVDLKNHYDPKVEVFQSGRRLNSVRDYREEGISSRG